MTTKSERGADKSGPTEEEIGPSYSSYVVGRTPQQTRIYSRLSEERSQKAGHDECLSKPQNWRSPAGLPRDRYAPLSLSLSAKKILIRSKRRKYKSAEARNRRINVQWRDQEERPETVPAAEIATKSQERKGRPRTGAGRTG